MIDENHLLDIVDEKNKIIGMASKMEKFEKELISRNVVAFIENRDGKYIIVKRSLAKKSFPGLMDISVCGNVEKGETYLAAIKREIKEELGVEVKELKFLKKVYNETVEKGKRVRYFTGIYEGKIEEEVKITHDEFVEYDSMTAGELDKLMKNSPEIFTPFFVNDYRNIFECL